VPRSNHTAENAWTVIAWPCHHKFILHAARSPTFFWSFESDFVKYLASVKRRAAICQTRLSPRDETSVAISVPEAAHSSIKAAAMPVSETQPGSYYVISWQYQCFTSGILLMAENKNQSRWRATEVIPRRSICERNVSVQQRSTGRHPVSIASPSRINCVRNKVRKTIVSANQVRFAAFIAYTRSYLYSRWPIERRYLSDSARP